MRDCMVDMITNMFALVLSRRIGSEGGVFRHAWPTSLFVPDRLARAHLKFNALRRAPGSLLHPLFFCAFVADSAVAQLSNLDRREKTGLAREKRKGHSAHQRPPSPSKKTTKPASVTMCK